MPSNLRCLARVTGRKGEGRDTNWSGPGEVGNCVAGSISISTSLTVVLTKAALVCYILYQRFSPCAVVLDASWTNSVGGVILRAAANKRHFTIIGAANFRAEGITFTGGKVCGQP